MPELPEVETSLRGIAPYVKDQVITACEVRENRLRWPVDSQLPRLLNGRTVERLSRRGKYLMLEFNQDSLMIHLGMSGSLRIVEKSVPPQKHDHIDILFDNGKLLRYNDPRRFGSVIYNQQGLHHPLLESLGPEPLSPLFDAAYLYQACRGRSAAIKPVIMDSHIVVGVGNIYAQESLFAAGIHPKRAASKISRQRIAKLVPEIKLVLQKAIEAGGSSLKDFTSADGKPGYFQHDFKVYGRGGEPCMKCQSILKQAVIGQRATVYCAQCQR